MNATGGYADDRQLHRPRNVAGAEAHMLYCTKRDSNRYGSTVCINITWYADHSDRVKYTSLPVDQG